MKISALVENRSTGELKPKHGLSLYVETEKHKILFDVGPDNTLFENAEKCNIDLTEIDTVIISHGHRDHGGALEKFLETNSKAKIYIQRKAFDKHYNKFLFLKIDIGLKSLSKDYEQIILLDGDYKIDDELSVFTVKGENKCYSPANDVLYEGKHQDEFLHEQNLIIKGKKTALIMGCGHKGIVNIMEKAWEHKPEICIGGYHLYNPMTKESASPELLAEIAEELNKYKDTQFYTCHCTGEVAYETLSKLMSNLSYLSCGETITVD